VSAPPTDDVIGRIAEWVANAKRLVVFTGAGVSTESGIPDFRSPNGAWARYDPLEFSYQNFIASSEGRRKYWQVGREIYATMRHARPNAAHVAIAELATLGLLDSVITQNVDGLHQKAGVSPERVIELHGNATRARCLSCGGLFPRDEIQDRLERGETVPVCAPPCSGILKPTTILFGEAMPVSETREADRRAADSDCFLVVGSSLVVYPAAMYPIHAKRSGAKLIIVNLDPTPHDPYADAVVHEKAGPFMEALLSQVRTRLNSRSEAARG
jgi:NAD-dependent deacetylase